MQNHLEIMPRTRFRMQNVVNLNSIQIVTCPLALNSVCVFVEYDGFEPSTTILGRILKKRRSKKGRSMAEYAVETNSNGTLATQTGGSSEKIYLNKMICPDLSSKTNPD